MSKTKREVAKVNPKSTSTKNVFSLPTKPLLLETIRFAGNKINEELCRPASATLLKAVQSTHSYATRRHICAQNPNLSADDISSTQRL